MEKGRIMDVDEEAFSEIYGDEQELEKSLSGLISKEEKVNWFSNYFKDPKTNFHLKDQENYLATSSVIKGIQNQKQNSLEQKDCSSHKGISQLVKENPFASVITGAALAGVAFLLIRHFRKNSSEPSYQRKIPKRKKIFALENKVSKSFKEQVSDQSEETHQEEPLGVTREVIAIAAASALGGSIAGTALGDISLLAAIPVAIIGFRKRNLNVAMASIGMALANGYQTENKSGNFIQRSLKRIKSFMGNLFCKIFPWIEEGEREGYYKSILGYIPLSQIA